MEKDLRSPLAKARDDWFESAEGRRCSTGFAEGKYLKNRLECAFIAGAKAQENTTANGGEDGKNG